MLLSGAPTKTTVPFANSGAKNTIPVAASATPGLASYTTGFPALTMTPLSAGGIPPAGQDFNGILNAISQAVQYYSAGATFVYDSTFSSAVSGYPKGAVLQNSSGTGLWFNTTDGNTTNPDSSGAGWMAVTSGRLLAIRTITTTQVYAPTVGTNFVYSRGQGAGAAGGGCPSTATGNTAAGLGGSAGAYWEDFRAVSALTGLTMTIGTAGVSVNGGAGGAGGATSFGSLLIAPGGTGGGVGQNLTPPWLLGESGNSAIATGGNIINAQGPSGGQAFSINTNAIVSGRGGNSPFGAGGNSKGNVTSAGAQATGPGAGGSGAILPSGAATTAGGGPGFAGIIEIWEFA